jgi:hypothetical protein
LNLLRVRLSVKQDADPPTQTVEFHVWNHAVHACPLMPVNAK